MLEPFAQQPEVLEELTAYLDGELDAAARDRVEQRLAHEPEFRHELQRLERSWELLDRLPRASVDDSFTHTTMAMVAVAAEEDLQALEAKQPRSKGRLWLLTASGALAAGWIGFSIGQWLWPSPNQQLLRDLPLLENFDLYRHADSVEFLRLLEKEKLFIPEEDHAG